MHSIMEFMKSWLTQHWIVTIVIIAICLIVAFVLACMGIITIRFKLGRMMVEIEGNFPFIRKRIPDLVLYKNLNDQDFVRHFKNLAAESSKIIFIGTGLELLFYLGLDFIDETIKKAKWEIYMANPYSSSVEMRLFEEQTGSPNPPINKEGLIQRVETIIGEQQRLRSISDNKDFQFCLFSHYPTYSLFILDKYYFFYPYGFSLLGNYSPIAEYRVNNPQHNFMINFLNKQYERIRDFSVDARIVQNANCQESITEEEQLSIRNNLEPLAIFLIPAQNSALYQFGTELLGYDIRKRSAVSSKWPQYTEKTSFFGFHLTVADVLYFTHKFDVGLLVKEITALSRQLTPFKLNYKISEDFPEKGSISLVCRDESGTLESLHHEAVCRCYKRAASSNYSLSWGINRAKADRMYADNPERTKLMLNLYHAPYILGQFIPHFSLLSDIPATEINKITKELCQNLPPQPVLIKGMCILSKYKESKYWHIVDELAFH